MAFALLFITYPACSKIVFSYFICETWDGEGEDERRFLRADRSLDCDSDDYVKLLPYAFLMLVVYPIGVPFYYSLLLYRSRHELHELRTLELLADNEHKTMALHDRVYGSHGLTANKAVARIERRIDRLKERLDPIAVKLTAGYEMRCYWFEVFECARKILLIGTPIIFEYGSIEQLFIGSIVCFLTFGVYCALVPYEDYNDDILARLCQLELFFCLLTSLILRQDPHSPWLAIALPVSLVIPPLLIIADLCYDSFFDMDEPGRCTRCVRACVARSQRCFTKWMDVLICKKQTFKRKRLMRRIHEHISGTALQAALQGGEDGMQASYDRGYKAGTNDEQALKASYDSGFAAGLAQGRLTTPTSTTDKEPAVLPAEKGRAQAAVHRSRLSERIKGVAVGERERLRHLVSAMPSRSGAHPSIAASAWLRRPRPSTSDPFPLPEASSSVATSSAAAPAPCESTVPAATYAATLTRTPLGLGLSLSDDSVVTEVKAGSQASRAGIQPGDQVVSIQAQGGVLDQIVTIKALKSRAGLDANLQGLPHGTSLLLELKRGGASAAAAAPDSRRSSALPSRPPRRPIPRPSSPTLHSSEPTERRQSNQQRLGFWANYRPVSMRICCPRGEDVAYHAARTWLELRVGSDLVLVLRWSQLGTVEPERKVLAFSVPVMSADGKGAWKLRCRVETVAAFEQWTRVFSAESVGDAIALPLAEPEPSSSLTPAAAPAATSAQGSSRVLLESVMYVRRILPAPHLSRASHENRISIRRQPSRNTATQSPRHVREIGFKRTITRAPAGARQPLAGQY